MVTRNVRKTVARPVRTNTRTVAVVSVDDVVLNSVVANVRRNGSWSGSMSELVVRVRRDYGNVRQVQGWPQNARGMRAVVDRLARRLRTAGIKVRFGRTTDHARKRFVEFR